eukprot:7149659-Alexandrium_andersonii.AAC.1
MWTAPASGSGRPRRTWSSWSRPTLAAGKGRALPARAPHDRGLLGRGLCEAPDGAAGGPVWDRAHVQ